MYEGLNRNINKGKINHTPFVTQIGEIQKERYRKLNVLNKKSKQICSDNIIHTKVQPKLAKNKFKYNSRFFLRSPLQSKSNIDKSNDKAVKLVRNSVKNIDRLKNFSRNKDIVENTIKFPNIYKLVKAKFDKRSKPTEKLLTLNNNINENKNTSNILEKKNEAQIENKIKRGFLFQKSNRFLNKTIKNILSHRHHIYNPNCKDIVLASIPKFDFSKACERLLF